jgi:hypothetical protein
MPNTVIAIRSSATPAGTPSLGVLANGELAINYADGILYYKTAANTLGTIGGGGTPGGLTTEVQFNDAGSFGGNANFTFNKTIATLNVSNINVSTNLITNTFFVNGTIASTSNTTGALRVAGGLGVAGNLHANNIFSETITTGNGVSGIIKDVSVIFSNTFVANGTTASTSNTTGAARVAGGLGVAGNLHANTIFSETITTGSAQGGLIKGADVIYSNTFVANGTTSSTSNTTGAARVAGGLGVAGNLHANTIFSETITTGSANGGTITGADIIYSNTFVANATTASTSNTTGALRVAGGLGVTGNLHANNIGIASTIIINSNRTIQNYGLTHQVLGSGSGTRTINLALGNFISATVAGTTTFAFSNPLASPIACGAILELTNGGSAAITWTNVRWASGIAPTLTTSGVDILTFITDDGGTNWRGVVSSLNNS